MIVKTEAVVLRSRRFRETSKIVSFYTRRYGKISAVAKGARNARSKFGASLEPMTGVLLVLYKKEQRELQLVSQCDILKPYKKIHSDMDRMAVGMSMIELLYQLTHDEEENPALFSLLEESLDALEAAAKNFENFFYAYELRLCSLFGFAPVLSSCIRCGTDGLYAGPSRTIPFLLDKGGLLCPTCEGSEPLSSQRALKHTGRVPLQKRTARIMEHLFTADLRGIGALEYPPDVGNELDETLRSYLQYHFEDLRPLRSARVFRSLTIQATEDSRE